MPAFWNWKEIGFFLKVGHSRPLFIYFCLFNTVDIKQVNKQMFNKILPMTGVDPRTSGIESERSTNWATTTSRMGQFFCGKKCWKGSKRAKHCSSKRLGTRLTCAVEWQSSSVVPFRIWFMQWRHKYFSVKREKYAPRKAIKSTFLLIQRLPLICSLKGHNNILFLSIFNKERKLILKILCKNLHCYRRRKTVSKIVPI